MQARQALGETTFRAAYDRGFRQNTVKPHATENAVLRA
jgi:hypothetical protein